MSAPSRNDSCPCGSGKKYKKCCLPRDEAARPRPAAFDEEKHFIAELRPDLDDEVDRLLERVELGDRSGIEEKIVALYKKHPRYHATNFAMGTYKLLTEDLSGAISYFEKAVKILPPFPEAHFNLGNVAVRTGDIVKGVAAYQMAERYSSDDDGIADMARKALRNLEAIVVKTSPFRSLDAYVNNAKLFNEAFECLTARRFERAVELFKRVLDENPEHVQSYGNMALALAGLGRRAEAKACFDRALELDPQYEPALVNRGVIEEMREGEPHVPAGTLEVEYYADKIRKRSSS